MAQLGQLMQTRSRTQAHTQAAPSACASISKAHSGSSSSSSSSSSEESKDSTCDNWTSQRPCLRHFGPSFNPLSFHHLSHSYVYGKLNCPSLTLTYTCAGTSAPTHMHKRACARISTCTGWAKCPPGLVQKCLTYFSTGSKVTQVYLYNL